MAREAKYTRTVAFRVTAEEWEAIQDGATKLGVKPSSVVRGWITPRLVQAIQEVQGDRKRAEAKAKRDAKKAQAANDNA